MHLRFGTALAVVSTPPSPHGAAQTSLRPDRFVSGSGSGARRLPRFGALAQRDHRMGVSSGNRLVAFARVVSGFCRDGPNGHGCGSRHKCLEQVTIVVIFIVINVTDGRK